MVRKTILFVDDSSFLRTHLSAALAGSNYDVHAVDDGEQALDWIAHHSPANLVITDLHMPKLDGIALVSRLRAHRDYCRAPIFVMTTGARDDEKERVRAAGATAWIVKPFDRDKLLNAIERVVH